jgi:outer membrane protein assembly factor BamB
MRGRLAFGVCLVVLFGAMFSVPAGAVAQAALTVSPSVGPPTTRVTLTGSGFQVNETVDLSFDGHPTGQATADGQGGFSVQGKVPRPARPGSHTFSAVGESSGSTGHAPFAVRTDWPQFRFDDRHDGVQPFENVLNSSNAKFMTEDWQAQLGDIVVNSSPAVVGGVVYIGSSDGTLWAYSADGCGGSLCTVPIWKSTNVAQIIDSPTVANGKVYVGSQTSFSNNDGKLDVFDANGCGQAVCAPLWQGSAGPQSILDSSPAVANGVVYVGSFDHKLYAFDANGCGQAVCQPLWTGTTGSTIESSPTVANGTVFIGSDDGKLYAFPAAGCGQASCQPSWIGPIGFPVFNSSPAVSGGTVYIGSAHALAAFPAAGCGQSSCQPLWKGQYQGILNFINGSPAVRGGRVFIGVENEVGVFDANGCGQAVCGPLWLDFGSGSQAAVLSSPTVANGVVYAGRNTEEVLAWPEKPCGQFICNEIWRGLTNDSIVSSSPTVVNGKLYIGSADKNFPPTISGRIYVFDLP